MDQDVMSLKYMHIYIVGGSFIERNTVTAQG